MSRDSSFRMEVTETTLHFSVTRITGCAQFVVRLVFHAVELKREEEEVEAEIT